MTDAPSDQTPEQAPSSSPEPARPEAEAPQVAALQPEAPQATPAAEAAQPTVEQTAAAASGESTVPSDGKRRPAPVGVIAALAIGALVGGVSGAGVGIWAVTSNTGSPVSGDSSPTTVTVNDAADATIITAVAAQASPSVVTIGVAGGQSGGTGSGVILSEDGYVLTNAHVVTLDGSVADPTITVTTNEGRLYTATVVGIDPIADLAVIKLTDASGLDAATFADSSKLNVGDTAVAIGAPLGLAGTVSSGIVSALNRSITVASSALPDEHAVRGHHATRGGRTGSVRLLELRHPRRRHDASRVVRHDLALRHPDRRRDQPGQLRWRTAEHRRRGHRHQRGDRLRGLIRRRRQHRRRIRDPVQPRRAHRQRAHRERHRDPRTARRLGARRAVRRDPGRQHRGRARASWSSSPGAQPSRRA